MPSFVPETSHSLPPIYSVTILFNPFLIFGHSHKASLSRDHPLSPRNTSRTKSLSLRKMNVDHQIRHQQYSRKVYIYIDIHTYIAGRRSIYSRLRLSYDLGLLMRRWVMSLYHVVAAVDGVVYFCLMPSCQVGLRLSSVAVRLMLNENVVYLFPLSKSNSMRLK